MRSENIAGAWCCNNNNGTCAECNHIRVLSVVSLKSTTKPSDIISKRETTYLLNIYTYTATMNLRQKIQVILLIFLILFAFASYHEGSGSTMWLQWLAIIAIMAYMFIFDVAFTNESSFIFDPDAENWRRKTVRCRGEMCIHV
jgi:hypothetical protein